MIYLVPLAALVLDRLGFGLFGGWELFRPDLVLLAVVYLALAVKKPTWAVLTAWLTGFLIDLTGWGLLGANALSFAVVSLLVFTLRGLVYRRSAPVRLFMVVGAGFFHRGLLWLIALLSRTPGPSGGWEMAGQVLITLVLGLPLFALFDRWLKPSYEA
ncbi:rod shape-determining protein MreD [bacterium]|nr:rod shape-determining protein MreD [bacterium]